MQNIQAIRCRNTKIDHNPKIEEFKDRGGLLFVLMGNSIYAKCNGKSNYCRHWTKLEVSFPGIDLDFGNAALRQSVMPKYFKFPKPQGKDINPATVLIED